MSYLGSRYNLEEDVGMPEASMASASASPTTAAAGGAAMKTNPYLLGGSFLLSYMKAKEDEFKRKQQQEMQIQQQYAQDQEQALGALNNTWKSALR